MGIRELIRPRLAPSFQNGLHCFDWGLRRCIEPKPNPRGRYEQGIELGSICLPGTVGDLANFSLSGVVTLKDYSQAGAEHDEVSRPCLHRLQPGPDVFAEDIVLDDRGKSGPAILCCHQC